MQIESIGYIDNARQWELKETSFGHLTLLVGASGVGKTQILRAIRNLANIVEGKSLNGVQWRIRFKSSDADQFVWEGEFEDRGYEAERIFPEIDEDENEDAPKIIWESLKHNEKKIIKRESGNIFFNGVKTVKLPPEKSAINLLREEEQIAVITSAFKLVTLSDYTTTSSGITRLFFSGDISESVSKYSSIEDIRNSDEETRAKLYLCSLVSPGIFGEIVSRFIEIFPFVEEVKIEPIKDKRVSGIFKEFPFVQIREKGVQNWIDDRQISSGMYRTLLQISDLYLCANGTVFLIDEFENSLGINCIDDLTSILLSYQRDLQFIVTSHHPYIINNISYKNWKIVTRKGGVVTARDVSEYNLGKSKHQAFTQLINLDAYTEGVEG